MVAFSNPITGGQGALVRPAIKSPNYVPGVSGWSINRSGDAEFNDLTIRGVFDGNNYEINDQGIFLYSGTPALGNLVVSITNDFGTDQYGNEYLEGIVNYAGDEFVGIDVGNTYYGLLSSGGYSGAGLVGIVGTGTSIFYQSPFYTGSTNISTFTLNSGDSSQPWSSVNYPHMHIGDSGYGMVWVDGAVIKTNPTNSDIAETWHTVGASGQPAYNTGWSQATAIGSITPISPLRYRMTERDTVIIEGAFTAASGAGSAVFQIPAAYRPAIASPPLFATIRNGSTNVTNPLYLSTAGNLNTAASLGSGATAGAVYYINGEYQLGNVS